MMFKIVEVNGVLTVRKASRKLSNSQQADNWLAERKDIERLRAAKVAKKDRREYMRAVNKQNRKINARLRAA
jgi:hypothetical protein